MELLKFVGSFLFSLTGRKEQGLVICIQLAFCLKTMIVHVQKNGGVLMAYYVELETFECA